MNINVYVFNVPLAANKNEIVDAIKAQYDVEINAIKTLVQTGKSVRFSRGKNRYPGTTTRSDSKKAYVTLAPGSSLAIFEQPADEAPATNDKSEETK